MLFRDQKTCDACFFFSANSFFNCLIRKTALVVDLPPIKPNCMSSVFINCLGSFSNLVSYFKNGTKGDILVYKMPSVYF